MKPLSFLRLFLGLLFTATGLAKVLEQPRLRPGDRELSTGPPDIFLLPLGICISLAEVWIGTNLLRAQRVRLSLWGTLLFQVGYVTLAATKVNR